MARVIVNQLLQFYTLECYILSLKVFWDIIFYSIYRLYILIYLYTSRGIKPEIIKISDKYFREFSCFSSFNQSNISFQRPTNQNDQHIFHDISGKFKRSDLTFGQLNFLKKTDCHNFLISSKV